MSRLDPGVFCYVVKFGRFVDTRLVDKGCANNRYSETQLDEFVKEHFDDGRKLYRYEDTDEYKEAVAYRRAVRSIVYGSKNK